MVINYGLILRGCLEIINVYVVFNVVGCKVFFFKMKVDGWFLCLSRVGI